MMQSMKSVVKKYNIWKQRTSSSFESVVKNFDGLQNQQTKNQFNGNSRSTSTKKFAWTEKGG